jgi:hypothetical protein
MRGTQKGLKDQFEANVTRIVLRNLNVDIILKQSEITVNLALRIEFKLG